MTTQPRAAPQAPDALGVAPFPSGPPTASVCAVYSSQARLEFPEDFQRPASPPFIFNQHRVARQARHCLNSGLVFYCESGHVKGEESQ